MSRAFVDEDAGSDEAEGMHDIPLPLPSGSKNYMTAEGAATLSDELRSLSEVERPKAAAALAASADDATAIRRIAELDRRISYLGRMKAALEVVDEAASTERVVFGLVILVEEEDGEKREYRIVGADESDPDRGLLCWASPVARALIGKGLGEVARARLPKGEKKMRILGIRHKH